MRFTFSLGSIILATCLIAGLSGVILAPQTHAASPVSSLLESILDEPTKQEEAPAAITPPQQTVTPIPATPAVLPAVTTPITDTPSTSAPTVLSPVTNTPTATTPESSNTRQISTKQAQSSNAVTVPVRSSSIHQSPSVVVANNSPSTGAKIVGITSLPSPYADQQASLLANPRIKTAGIVVASGCIVIGSLLLLLARRSYKKISLGFPRFMSAARQSSR